MSDRVLRVAAHVHSTWSYDGNWSLSQIAVGFRALGFDAVLMAEHDRGFSQERWARYRAECAARSRSRGPLLVPGIEYADPDDVVHVPVWGAGAFLGEGRPTGEMLRAAREADAVALLAHPGRRDAWRRVDAAWFELLTGVETWNRRYDGPAPGARGAEILAAAAGRLLPFATLDFHATRDLWPLAMLVEVDGPASEEAIVDALRRGRCRPQERAPRRPLVRQVALAAARRTKLLR